MPDHTEAERDLLLLIKHGALPCEACGAEPVKRTEADAPGYYASPGITLLLCPACCGEAEAWLESRRTEAGLRARIEELEHKLALLEVRVTDAEPER
jgi:hypothetical protein